MAEAARYALADAPGAGADVPASDRGALDVRDRVVEQIARRSALEVPGCVRTQASTLLGHGYPTASVEVRAGHAWVTLEVAVRWPAPVEQVAARVRDHVRARTAELAGVAVERVDTTVHVVVQESERGGRVR